MLQMGLQIAKLSVRQIALRFALLISKELLPEHWSSQPYVHVGWPPTLTLSRLALMAEMAIDRGALQL